MPWCMLLHLRQHSLLRVQWLICIRNHVNRLHCETCIHLLFCCEDAPLSGLYCGGLVWDCRVSWTTSFCQPWLPSSVFFSTVEGAEQQLTALQFVKWLAENSKVTFIYVPFHGLDLVWRPSSMCRELRCRWWLLQWLLFSSLWTF